jgi:hypothetical protein
MKEEVPQMDCKQFEEILHDLDRPGTTGAALSESALGHAESCSRCAALLTQSEWLDFALLELRKASAEKQAPPRVEAALVGRFRRAKGIAARQRIFRQAGILSAAAGVILVVGVALSHRPEPGPVQGVASNAAATPAQPKQAIAPPTEAAPPEAASSEASDNEYATDFYPLPSADDSTAADGGAVVRVVLSRSALASLGLPVVDAGNGEPISADLVVSVDGTPQAIRLVSQTSASREF